MEEGIIWNEMSLEEFKPRFEKLGKSKKCRNFLLQNQENIANLRNAQILSYLCSVGYFQALLPLLECGNEEQKYLAFTQVYGKEIRSKVRVGIDFHRKVMEYAAKDLRMMIFVRNKTVLLQGFESCTEYIREDIYKNATQDVIDYLFGWVIRYRIPIHKSSGKYLFSKASKGIIISYVKVIGSFTGKSCYVDFHMLNDMFCRNDLTTGDKKEIVRLTLNKCKVSSPTLTKINKTDFLA